MIVQEHVDANSHKATHIHKHILYIPTAINKHSLHTIYPYTYDFMKEHKKKHPHKTLFRRKTSEYPKMS